MSDFDQIDQTPTPSTPDLATPDPNAAAPATPNAPAPGAATPRPSNEGMVPSYRLRETREAAIRESTAQWQAREAQYQSQLQQVQNQLRALVGVAPPTDPEADAVRQQFDKLYPGLAKLNERYEDIMGVVDRTGDIESQTQHYWTSYGRNAMDRLFSQAATTYGAPLNEEGKAALHASFLGYVQSSPELTARYTQDPTLVDEFWRGFSSNFIDPVRRAQAAQVEQRTTLGGLPQDAPGGAPQMSQAPRPGSLDERVSGAWASYNAALKR